MDCPFHSCSHHSTRVAFQFVSVRLRSSTLVTGGRSGLGQERERKIVDPHSLPPMGLSKHLPLLLLMLVLVRIGANQAITGDPVALHSEKTDSGLRLEVDCLRSKISALESVVAANTLELRSRDDSLALIERIIEEKLETINSLHREIESIQKKDAINAAELMEKAHIRSASLEKQIETLKSELRIQTHIKDAWESRATGAEKSNNELTSKVKALQKTIDEQKRLIQKIERLLKNAELDLLKAKSEAASKKKELAEVHGAWLPTWLATHSEYCKEYAKTHWDNHGKPALDALLQKTSEISDRTQRHVELYLGVVNDKWLPALMEQCMSFSKSINPYVRRITTKIIQFHDASLTAIGPHVIRLQEVAHPYFQEAKKFSRPYIDQVASATKPHVEKVRITLKPYTKKGVRVYGKFLKSASAYHHQVQEFVHEELTKNELTKTLATKKLVCFLASVSVAVPIYLIYLIIEPFLWLKHQHEEN